jgi:hypothetical protein
LSDKVHIVKEKSNICPLLNKYKHYQDVKEKTKLVC